MTQMVKWVLRLCYGYFRLIGVVNFAIDFRTGRAYTTPGITIYALMMNALIFSVPVLLYYQNVLHMVWARARMLHEYLFGFILILRACCVGITLFSRWSQRQYLLQLIQGFRRLHRKFYKSWMLKTSRQITLKWRLAILKKFFWVVLADLLQCLLGLESVGKKLTVSLTISSLLLHMVTSIMNAFICHYYFAMLTVYMHYLVLNEELARVVNKTKELLEDTRGTKSKGVFVTKCCALTDRLEEIQQAQNELQQLYKRTTRIFRIQGLCVTAIFYISNIAIWYLAYCVYKYDFVRMGWTTWRIVFVFSSIFCFLADIRATSYIGLKILDTHAETVELLKERTHLYRLDERLDATFESFQLQIIRNPLKLSVYGLYTMDRTKLIAMAGSLITHILILIQYDIKNF